MAIGLTAGAIAGLAGIGALGNMASGAMNATMQYHYQKKLQKDAQAWQERMSNTAHQREVKDLQLAGINPLYTATGGSGASSGTVGAGSAGMPQIDLANAYMSGLSTMHNIKNQTTATNAEAMLKQTQSEDIIAGMQERLVRMEKMSAETDLTRYQRHLIDAQIDQMRANIKQLNSLADLNVTNAKYTRGQIALLGKDRGNSFTFTEGFNTPVFSHHTSRTKSYNRY